MPDEFDEMRHMWDGSEQWVLIRSEQEYASLTLHFAKGGPSLLEMARTRQLLPECQHLPPAEVKRRLKGRDRLELGRMSPQEAGELASHGRLLGLTLEERRTSVTGYLPFRPEGSIICLIEDNDLAERVTSTMREAGVPIVENIPGAA